MAQKNKKQARKTPSTRQKVESPAVDTVSASPAPSGSMSRSFSTEFNPDYSQTIKDLRRIAILAGTFLVILIVLAFVLP